MRTKCWLICWILLIMICFSAVAAGVYHVDPYFHYHKPHTDTYYYTLYNERAQNNGICRHFKYDAVITGTSLSENFRTSEMDRLFGCNTIKVCFQGGTYKEINDNLAVALKANTDLKTVVRCLDLDKLIEPADYMRTDLGRYPTYLYDRDPLNDAEYVLNWNIFSHVAAQVIEQIVPDGKEAGIDSFDDYYCWQKQPECYFGKNAICPDGVSAAVPAEQLYLTEEERTLIKENITQNVTSLADEYPDVVFYYYFSPYSVMKWVEALNGGTLARRIEAEKLAAGLILQHENICLFSFNTRPEIVIDLNNYMDFYHYGIWINSLILKWLHDGSCRLTKDNYEEYFREEYEFYLDFDYESLNSQEDYEADYYAGALLNNELTGAEPLDLLASGSIEKTLEGGRITVDLSNGHNYLMYTVSENARQADPAVFVFDESGRPVGDEGNSIPPKDGNIHMHVIDLSTVNGPVTIVFNGVFCEKPENSDNNVFYGVMLY